MTLFRSSHGTKAENCNILDGSQKEEFRILGTFRRSSSRALMKVWQAIVRRMSNGRAAGRSRFVTGAAKAVRSRVRTKNEPKRVVSESTFPEVVVQVPDKATGQKKKSFDKFM